jgi:hypothetical protein
MQLTVVYAMAREGLSPDDAFAMRGKIIQARPIDFEFKPPNAYIAFFPCTAEGLQKASELADVLRGVAREKALLAFGVGVLQGECLAQLGASGRFAGKPAGTVISLALTAAMQEAETVSVA